MQGKNSDTACELGEVRNIPSVQYDLGPLNLLFDVPFLTSNKDVAPLFYLSSKFMLHLFFFSLTNDKSQWIQLLLLRRQQRIMQIVVN